MERLNTAPHDAVTELLATLRVHSTVYCLSELREPWGFEVNGANVPKFHLVLAGSCWLDLPGHEPVQLQTGDLVILSRGERHVVSARPGSPVPSLDSIIASHPLDGDARLTYGGTGALRTCAYVDRWPQPRLTALATTAAGSVAFGLDPLGGFVTWQRSLPSTKSTTWTIGFTHPSGKSSSGPWESRASFSPIPRTPTV